MNDAAWVVAILFGLVVAILLMRAAFRMDQGEH
jgi:hypothetical protein